MFIHEAVLATTPKNPYIKRKAWGYVTTTPHVAIKLQPTDSPDGCVLHSITEPNPRRGWQPTAGDLVADDWVVIGL